MVGGLAGPWSVTAASAAPGDQSVVSVNENGDPAAGGYGTVSANGRYVVFDSYASLVAADTNAVTDVYVRDREAGVTKLASVSATGLGGNLASSGADVSDDGNLVVFSSTATNLVPDDSNGTTDVFVHNVATGETRLVSRQATGAQATKESYTPLISGDGRFVTFASQAALVPEDINGDVDVYRVDLVTAQLDLVTRLEDGTAGLGWPSGISEDGLVVAFETPAAFVAADTNGSVTDVYVRDYAADEVQLASAGANGESGNGFSGYSELSADGRYVAFTTRATSFGNPDNDLYDVVWHDRTTGQNRIVSETTDGQTEDGWSAHPSISGHGRYVAFHTTSSNLAPVPAREFGSEVLVRDMQTGAIVLASPTTTGDLPDGNAEVPSISADGRFVLYYGSNSHLVGSGGFRGATYVHEIDFPPATAPDVAIDSGPAGRTAESDPAFTFSSTNPDATFECFLASEGDADRFEPCTSPASTPGLADGDYVFKVRASHGGLTSDLVTRSFTVDTTGPIVSLEGGPPATTDDNTPTFPFSAEPGTTFTCSLTRTTDEFVPCTSPITYPSQADGVVTFKVLGTDLLGNTGLLTQYTFTIDTTDPLAAPSTPDLSSSSDTGTSTTDNVTGDTTPTFTGTAPAGTTVTLLVDGVANANAVTTGGAYTITTSALAVGQHSITARASDSTQTSEPSGALSIQITAPPTACETAANTLTGTATSNTITGGRLADRILGLDGNDTLDGRANNDCLLGGTGNDQLRGGVGNDELSGEDGTDTLTLGDGVDVGQGGAGNDRITSRDASADRVDCGTGTADVVIADNLDTVVNCETVRRG